MNIRKLAKKALRNESETSKIEFKDCRGGFSKKIWKSISSFSNTSPGGVIVFGVEENSVTRELKVVDNLNLASLQERVASFINEEMQNCDQYDIETLNLEG